MNLLRWVIAAHGARATIPPPPWESFLPLALDAFAATGAGLQVTLPHLGETIWLDWMEAEAERGGLPRTVGGFIEGLEGGGPTIGWVPAPTGSGV